MSRVITSEEVTKHNDKESVWMVIRNDVYDVTSFLEEHPGGEETLLEVAGQDGTQAFDDVGHSDDARELLKKFKIGSLALEDKMPESKYHSRPKFRKKSRSDCSVCSTASCPHLRPRRNEQASRPRDRCGSSRPVPKKHNCLQPEPRPERRPILAPRERRSSRDLPCDRRSSHERTCDSSGQKWKFILALASAALIGFALKKYFTSS